MPEAVRGIELHIELASVGQTAHRDRGELTRAGIVEIRWGDVALPVYVEAKTDEPESPRDDLRWAGIQLRAAAEMAKARRLCAFTSNNVSRYVAESAGDEMSVSVAVPEDYFRELEKDQQADAALRQKFEQAVRRLKGATDAAADNEAFRTLRQLLDAGYLGHDFSWYGEKMGRIYGILNPAKPRNNSRRGDSREKVDDLLYMFKLPVAWIERPSNC
jgi:hypothetical protein